MYACCSERFPHKRGSWGGRCREVAAWVLPSALLTLMPKCPACVAAYVAVWTGLGLSFTTASYLRTVLLIFCIASLLYLVVTRIGWFLGFTTPKERRQRR
jgi:hypothetical protein